jgi:hypothetical protein
VCISSSQHTGHHDTNLRFALPLGEHQQLAWLNQPIRTFTSFVKRTARSLCATRQSLNHGQCPA